MPKMALHIRHGTWSLKSGLTLNTDFATDLRCDHGQIDLPEPQFPPLENENIDSFVIDVLREFDKRICVKYLK